MSYFVRAVIGLARKLLLFYSASEGKESLTLGSIIEANLKEYRTQLRIGDTKMIRESLRGVIIIRREAKFCYRT